MSCAYMLATIGYKHWGRIFRFLLVEGTSFKLVREWDVACSHFIGRVPGTFPTLAHMNLVHYAYVIVYYYL